MARARQRLERIRICETVTAPMGALFTHILALDGKPVDALVARLRSEWGPEMRTIDPDQFSALEAAIGSIAPEVGQRWVAIANAGARGDYPLLLSLLCEQNHWVMSSRGGAQWVAAEEGQFQVRFRYEAGDLPKRADLPTLWRSPYFLESLRMVARALKES